MMALFLWLIVGAGLLGLAALGMAAHALVQVLSGINTRLARGLDSVSGEEMTVQRINRQDVQELERLRCEKDKLSNDLQEKSREINCLTSSLDEQKRQWQTELAEKEKAVRQEYQELEKEKEQLENRMQGLKAQQDEANAVKSIIEEIAPYVYAYGNWYHGETKDLEEGQGTSALWRVCQGNLEMCGQILDVFRYADLANRKQMYVQAAQLYEAAYRQTRDAETLADVKKNVGQLLTDLERGDDPHYALQWPEVGTRWDENTAKRLEENGQSTIVAVVRPIVLDLTNQTVFSLGIVKTGG